MNEPLFVVRPGQAAEGWVIMRRIPDSIMGPDTEVYEAGFRSKDVADVACAHFNELDQFEAVERERQRVEFQEFLAKHEAAMRETP